MLRLDGCAVDLRTGRVERDGRATTTLTTRERELLSYLSRTPSRDVPREVLLTELWGYSDQIVSRAIDSTVRRLREKIEENPSEPRHLLTAWGTGYRFEPGGAPAPAVVVGALPSPRADRWCTLGERRVDLEVGDVQGPAGPLSPLTATERALVAALARAGGGVIDAQALARTVWGRWGGDNNLHSLVYRVRRKLEPDPDAPRFLLTVRGIGFRLVARGNTTATPTSVVHVRVAGPADSDGLRARAEQLERSAVEAGGQATGDGWCFLFADPSAAARWSRAVHDGPFGDTLAVAVHRGWVVWWTTTSGRTLCAGPAVARCAELARVTPAGGYVVDEEVEARFVGRDVDLDSLATHLDTHRWVGVTGTGGIGKTRLAREWVARTSAATVWVDACHAATDSDVVRAVARAIELTVPGEDATAAVGRALAGRGPLLVVLDGCDGVGDPSLPIRAWCEAAEGVRFLTTRRRAFGAEDRTVALAPLPPDVTRGWAPDTERLPGVPLALELAAGRVDGALVQRLGQASTLQERVEQSIAWSLDRLEPEAAALVRQLCVFAGGFTGAAVEAVCRIGVSARIPDRLGALMSAGLVSEHGGRMTVPWPVREALAPRRPADESLEVERRHGAWCARFARRAIGLGRLPVHELVTEFDNLTAAHRAALARGDRAVAAGVALGLAALLVLRGPFAHAVTVLEDVWPTAPDDDRGAVARGLADALRLANRFDAVRERVEQWLPEFRANGDAHTVSALLGQLAQVELGCGQVERAAAHLTEAIEVARRAGAPSAPRLLSGLGALRCATGDSAAGVSLLREAVALEPDNPVYLGNLAAALLEARDLDPADEWGRLALECAQQDGNTRMEAYARGTLATLAYLRGDYVEAEEWALRARALHERVGNRGSVGQTDTLLGVLWTATGRALRAIPLLERAAATHAELGQAAPEARAWSNLGDAHRALGHDELALEAYGVAAALGADAEDPLVEAIALAHRVLTRPTAPDAPTDVARARALVERAERPDGVSAVWWAQAAVTDDPLEALRCYDRAIDAHGPTEPQVLGQIVCHRGALLARLGRRDEASRALAHARSLPSDDVLASLVERLARAVDEA